MQRRARILGAMFQGGGNVPLLMPIMARLVERGHTVRIMAGPGVRHSRLPVSAHFVQRIAESGASLVPFREPDNHPLDYAPPLKGVIGDWAPKQFAGIPAEAQTIMWAPAWAENVSAELRGDTTDLVLVDVFLLGALVAAEAAHIPSIALMHCVSIRPIAGVPPFGPGWLPSRKPFGHLRDALGRAALKYLYHRNGLQTLNATRASLGLAPLGSAFEQYDRASRVLMLVSSSFDFPGRLPANVQHVGTPIDDARATAWTSPWPPGDDRPLVVVALSTLNQRQAPLMHRILRALAGLNVRALVTLGPALDPTEFVAPPNVRLESFVPHSAVLRHAAALVTQCGLGTLTKALICGVPLVCVPLVGDQPENAARVVARGAGIRLQSDASPEQIRAAIERVVAEQEFRTKAHRLQTAIVNEGDAVQNAVETIEAFLPAASRHNRR